jgi:hypothetical protein
MAALSFWNNGSTVEGNCQEPSMSKTKSADRLPFSSGKKYAASGFRASRRLA